MPDPIRKRFGYGQLWPLRPACSQNRAGSYMPNPTSRIRFSSVFPKKAWIILCKPTRVRSGWPGHGLAKRIWSESKLVCRNHLAQFLAGRNRPATNFSLSDSVPSFTDAPDNIVQNQPGSVLVLAECTRFWPNGSSPEKKSQCARITRPASGRCFPGDPARMRIGSGMFTGTAQTGLWGRS